MFENKNLTELKISRTEFLRCMKTNDVSEAYLNWFRDSEVLKYTDLREIDCSEEALLAYVEAKSKSATELLLGIFKEKVLIGTVKLEVNWLHMRGSVAYLIGKRDCWGKGIATRAVQRVIAYAFDELDLEKIVSGYYAYNLASARVLEKLGFSVEGRGIGDLIYESERIDRVYVGLQKRFYKFNH